MKGHFKSHTLETKEKLSMIFKNRWKSGIYKNRINVTLESIEKGRKTQQKGKFINCIICNKSFYCSPSQIIRGRKYCSKKCNGLGKRCENHPKWKGGLDKYPYIHVKRKEYKNWRTTVFVRDGYTCKNCGIKCGEGKVVILHPHHIKSYTHFPELRYEISNGITLCYNCHIKVHSKKYGIQQGGVSSL